MAASPEFPKQIITNTENRSVSITPQVEATLPGIDNAFAEVDRAFLENPEGYLAGLESSMFPLHSSQGSDVACSLLYGPQSKPDEILVVFAPFADSDPKSSADRLHEYITADAPGGIVDKEKASPNSWSQTTKSAVIFELLGALGKGIPVLTIYSPIPVHAYSFGERASQREGDFKPAARLAQEAIAVAQSKLHGTDSETQIDKVHISGASLGASNAIGAASGLMDRDFDIRSVTAQELIMGPKNLADLGRRFSPVGEYVGEPSTEAVSRGLPQIEEPAIRKEIDKHGSEPIGMTARTLKGMSKYTYLKGLTNPERTVQAVEKLFDNNVSLLVALAENSGLTYETGSYLTIGGDHVIKIRGENGQRIGHLADEHVALSALVAALNIATPPRT